VKIACGFSAEVEKEYITLESVAIAEYYLPYLLRPTVPLQSLNALISHADIEICQLGTIVFTHTIGILGGERYVVGPGQFAFGFTDYTDDAESVYS
jgi:hypothetical protein